jgi:hypothetical protein
MLANIKKSAYSDENSLLILYFGGLEWALRCSEGENIETRMDQFNKSGLASWDYILSIQHENKTDMGHEL